VQNAYALLIMPDMLQGGLLIGAEHGVGVLVARDPVSGAWGDPAF
jgi:lipid-binding SYLF domain-containing protein